MTGTAPGRQDLLGRPWNGSAMRRTWHRARAGSRVVTAAVAGAVAVVVGLGTSLLDPSLAALAGWDVAAAVHLVLTWVTIWPMAADLTAAQATREDSSRLVSDVVLLGAAVASLAAVVVVLTGARHADPTRQALMAAFAVVSIALSWCVVHTVYCLHYARRYYTPPVGGIDFGDEPPAYADFAYLAFTVGMTYQVSDTSISSAAVRRVALHHALVSFGFGAVILASTVNLVSGLSG